MLLIISATINSHKHPHELLDSFVKEHSGETRIASQPRLRIIAIYLFLSTLDFKKCFEIKTLGYTRYKLPPDEVRILQIKNRL